MKDRTGSEEESFDMEFLEDRIILHGDLVNSPQVLAACRTTLEKVPKFTRIIVEADDTRIIPEGVSVWMEAVGQFLMGCELIYAPSQLALILQYDERYRHPKSIFREYEVSVA